MFYSKLFIPTLREVGQEAESVSHRLLLRGGFIRQLASGLYIFLPLGWRVMQRIIKILREEMDAIGAQEITCPVLHPSELWEATGRWFEIKDEMFRLKDRGGRNMCLGMTHEEVMAWLAAKEIRSYRELPQIWYQIQIKLRDEARPKAGIIRTREFIMKDSYSFDIDEEGLAQSYEIHRKAYHRIFQRCGLKFYEVESDPGMMGGGQSHEFMAPSSAGEDEILLCDKCGYAANVEVADSVPAHYDSEESNLEEVYTPGLKTVEEVSKFLGLQKEGFIKTLALMASEGMVLVLLRGDQQLHEKKLQKIIGPFRQALKEEILEKIGTEPGFIGPHGHKLRILADPVLKDGFYVSGANKKDYHVKGLRAGIHFEAEWYPLHVAREGEGCPKCNGRLKMEKAIEVGNIFKLGTKYSVPLKAFYLDSSGQQKPIIMGSYGIGPARIMAAAVEQNHDADGIIWPKSIAPFDIEIIPLSTGSEVMDLAVKIYNALRERGLDVLLDDRDQRPGVKFKDADLIGIPYQVIIGEKGLKEGYIELKERRTKTLTKLSPDSLYRYGF
ncbi:MAG: proline--tRNA ligase [Thermodesulfovibrionales bacterium]|nr:proline--tRNA ligase [Thermodesulfovibrionales bacterium]